MTHKVFLLINSLVLLLPCSNILALITKSCNFSVSSVSFPFVPKLTPWESINNSCEITGTCNLTISTLQLPSKHFELDFLEAFKGVETELSCFHFRLNFKLEVSGGATLYLKVFCNGQQILMVEVSFRPSELLVTINYQPGGRIHLYGHCSPFAAGYRVQFDVLANRLRFGRNDSDGYLAFEQSETPNVERNSCNCSILETYFQQMWVCKTEWKEMNKLSRKPSRFKREWIVVIGLFAVFFVLIVCANFALNKTR
uniref:(northern house mosquito) hypothetical protein n=2 Tax=Culex pipiens TaxID=7175 RepID=A0A8D8G0D9_CULPI